MKSTVLMLRVIIVLAAVTVTAGCIDFDGQLLSYRYDQAADTLRIFQLYEGIHTDKKAAPDNSEIDDLRSVVCGERTFLFTNRNNEFHRSGMETERRKFLKKAEEAGPGAEEWTWDIVLPGAIYMACSISNELTGDKMTGQILSGVSPVIVARYQIMVMCMIFGAAGLSTVCFLAMMQRNKHFGKG
jgi:hypothetical protein